MNTRTEAPLDTFETELLTELRNVVSERASTDCSPEHLATRRKPVRRTVSLAGVAAAAVIGLAVWQWTAPSDPAYAVEQTPDGTISFSLFTPTAADDLEAALSEHGLAADITVLPMGQVCAEGRYSAAGVDPNQYVEHTDNGVVATIPPDLLDDGETLVAEFSGLLADLQPGGDPISVDLAVAVGDVAACIPVDMEQG
ncbi:lipase chaperone [Ruania alba]|uniref:Uncharacterized protein n=1 Tax=Ruania alba TaxID=648782 RepID=A0A1H5G126_9MICO|nr:lipase chaperone [Ruania alba]SEE09357.1 hypothetical protein SAMN04488554_1507 [Ruania alba]